MDIFSENKTDRIIRYILEHPESVIKVTEIARALKVNKGSVSLTIKKLEKAKIVKNKTVDLSIPITRALKIFITVKAVSEGSTLSIMREYALAAGIYGSSAQGANTENSDIDIWIKPKPSLSRIKVSELSRRLSSILNKQVQIVAISNDRLATIKKESQNFYYSLVFGSITLFGEGIE